MSQKAPTTEPKRAQNIPGSVAFNLRRKVGGTNSAQISPSPSGSLYNFGASKANTGHIHKLRIKPVKSITSNYSALSQSNIRSVRGTRLFSGV